MPTPKTAPSGKAQRRQPGTRRLTARKIAAATMRIAKCETTPIVADVAPIAYESLPNQPLAIAWKMRGGDTPATDADVDRVRKKIVELLGPSPVDVDELIRQTSAPVSAVLTVLLELELAGRLTRHPGNKVSLA